MVVVGNSGRGVGNCNDDDEYEAVSIEAEVQCMVVETKGAYGPMQFKACLPNNIKELTNCQTGD